MAGARGWRGSYSARLILAWLWVPGTLGKLWGWARAQHEAHRHGVRSDQSSAWTSTADVAASTAAS